MRLLALCTSGPAASVALLEDGNVIKTLVGERGPTHSETIIPLCDGLLACCGLSIADMDMFAADIGPGSFTGVRIGVCVANALAYATGRKVVGVSYLAALAHDKTRGSVCALLDARNGNGYAAHYVDGRCAMPESPVVIAELLPVLPKDTLFVGEYEKHKALILSLSPGARFCEDDPLTAAAVASVAYAKRDGAQDEAFPLYLRPSQAERLFEERHNG